MSASLDPLNFLAGHWRGEAFGGVIEEMWLAPSGGVAQATVRLVTSDKVHTIELIVVADEGDRVTMRYHHFNPNLSTWESDGPIALTLTDARHGALTFTNLHEPQRDAAEAGYRLVGEDALNSWVVAISDDGTRTRHSFDYRRVMQ